MRASRVAVSLFVVAAVFTSTAADAKKKKAEEVSSGDPKAAAVEEEYGPQLPVATIVVAPPPYKFTRGEIMFGARVGGVLPEPFSNFGPSFLVGVEVGWQLPKLPGIGRGLTLTVDLAYTQPTASGVVAAGDPRIAANMGAYQWDVTQRQLTLGINVIYRFNMIGSGRVVPYIGVGPRFFFLQSSTGGHADANNNFPTYNEQSTHVGIGVPLGVDVLLGPGRIFVEASLVYATFNHNVTGSTNAGAINVEAGYRIFL